MFTLTKQEVTERSNETNEVFSPLKIMSQVLTQSALSQRLDSSSEINSSAVNTNLKTRFLKVIHKPFIYKLLKDFTNNRKKAACRVVVICYISFTNILRQRDHI